MMFGSWQVGRPGMKLRKPQERVRVRLRTAEREAVFFNGPVAELLTAEELAAHARLNALGPDLLAEEFDRQEAWRRLQADPNREIADAILDQTIVAGIGNIYKSEGLFLAGIDPRTAAGALPRPVVDRLWRTLIPLMRKGITDRRMRTRPRPKEGEDHHHWVYRRRGLPCFRCGSSILRIVQGKMKRSTYWCPTCQSCEASPEEGRPATGHTGQRNLPGIE
jgi:formamidopyrimidine-DNA glycosylase